MRILLIDPPFYRFIGYYNRYFPLGLASLAAVLQKKGHEVLIYDADEIAEKAIYLLKNPEIATLMGKKERERAKELFRWKTVAQKILDCD